MGRTSSKFKHYRLAVLVAGLIVFILVFAVWGRSVFDNWKEVLLFAVVCILAESLKINLQKSAAMSVSFLITYAVLVLFGPAAAVFVEAVSVLNVDDLRLRLPALTIGFNAGQLIISMGLAGFAYSFTGGQYGNPSNLTYPYALIPIFLSATTFFIINTFLVSLYISFADDSSLTSVWAYEFKWMIPNHYALTIIGVVLAYLFKNVGPAGIFLLIIPLLIARQTFQVFMKLKSAYLETVQSLVQALEAKDPYTRGHSERVAEYAEKIARQLRLSEEMVEMTRYAALLHDVGKIGISRRILNKPSRLSKDEYELVQEHPRIGAKIIQEVDFLREPLSAVLYHHEHIDGSGYAFGLQGEEIPLLAKILTVADSFDAMTSARPYRDGMNFEEAFEELKRCCGSQFDHPTAEAFLIAMGYAGEVEPALEEEPVLAET